MKKIFIASGNAHKIMEFKNIFETIGINDLEIVSPADFNDDCEPIEDGKSYAENSLIKAKYWFDKYNIATLADDSGIEIAYFDNKPGIYSARFLPDKNQTEKNQYIIDETRGHDDRASFNAVITYIDQEGLIKQYSGHIYGKIASQIKGSEGFGYDPIFIMDGFDKTNAELGQAFKNEHSHRAIALRKWAMDLEK